LTDSRPASARHSVTLATLKRPITLALAALFEPSFQISKQSREAFVELPPQPATLIAITAMATTISSRCIPRPYAADGQIFASSGATSPGAALVTFPTLAQASVRNHDAMSTIEIVTERLSVRPFQVDDLEAFVAYRSDPQVAR
jgi:hypothetical protein